MLVVPGDVFLGACSVPLRAVDLTEPKSSLQPSSAQLAEAASLLNSAGKITILGGAGCRDAHEEVIALAGRLNAPVVHALRGKEHLEYDNPFDTGMTGLLGFSSGYYSMMNCDALLMLGTDFPYRQFYPEKAKVVQVDSRGEQIGSACRYRSDRHLEGHGGRAPAHAGNRKGITVTSTCP